jgi:hypothetical protein
MFPASETIRTDRRFFALSLSSPIASPAGMKAIIAYLTLTPQYVNSQRQTKG